MMAAFMSSVSAIGSDIALFMNYSSYFKRPAIALDVTFISDISVKHCF